jgi:hypothetical protein
VAEVLAGARAFHHDRVGRVSAPQLARAGPDRRPRQLAKLVAVTDLYT